MILTTAIISIVISAPLGSIMTNTFGPKWLSNAKKEHGPEIKINQKTGSFHPRHGFPLKIRPIEEMNADDEKIRRIKTGNLDRADDDYFSESDDNKHNASEGDRNDTIQDLLKRDETQGGENVTKDEERLANTNTLPPIDQSQPAKDNFVVGDLSDDSPQEGREKTYLEDVRGQKIGDEKSIDHNSSPSEDDVTPQ